MDDDTSTTVNTTTTIDNDSHLIRWLTSSSEHSDDEHHTELDRVMVRFGICAAWTLLLLLVTTYILYRYTRFEEKLHAEGNGALWVPAKKQTTTRFRSTKAALLRSFVDNGALVSDMEQRLFDRLEELESHREANGQAGADVSANGFEELRRDHNTLRARLERHEKDEEKLALKMYRLVFWELGRLLLRHSTAFNGFQ